MPFSLSDWHRRYLQQAGWSRNLRKHLFYRFNFPKPASILEVGCGTGAVLGEYEQMQSISTFGLDIDPESLLFFHREHPQANLTAGDAHALPFANAFFDLTFCHYLLLWLKEPLSALREMRRVTKPGGWVCAFAEPDYVGRIAYPQELETLASLQIQSLAKQGASASMGRQLYKLFHDAGLDNIESGILAVEWKKDSNNLANEMETMKVDLAFIGKENILMDSQKRINESKGSIYFIPTFYAFGRV
jgi:ubiquinone/menaquinone biosynthesis C-methylase UbiE